MNWRFWQRNDEDSVNEQVDVNDAVSTWAESPANPENFPENSINYTAGSGNGELDEYERLYCTNYLAKHIIDFPIEDAFGQWRTWPSKYNASIDAEEDRIDYRITLVDAITTADIYGGSLIVMFVAGQTDMSAPLDFYAIEKGDLLRLAIFDPLQVNKIDVEETNPLSERFLLPNYYEIAGQISNGKIHHSRCIELHGMERPRISRRLVGNSQYMWGLSRLLPVKDLVKDYIETDSAISRLLNRLAVFFVKEPGVSHARTTKAFSRINKSIFNIARNIGLHGLLYGDIKSEIGSINNSVAGVSDIVERKQENVAGAGEIAVTRLFGKAKAGMSGDTNDGDLRNYQGYVQKYKTRKLYALKRLESVLVRSALGSNPDDCKPEWEEFSVQTSLERAEIELKTAQAKQAEAEAKLKLAQSKVQKPNNTKEAA
ncbi:TPA: DUF1073 domain-containing protein [Vibrio parahaemolyticus]|nr:DUF1073 domain-containing protein [Vibrio parahaemolyticus]HAV1545597.1 DUF1073 domain-containing protein [Vibrio parahaemolyticus]